MTDWRVLEPEPLTAEAFASFGEVLAEDLAEPDRINDGCTERFTAIASIDVTEAGGHPLVHLYRTSAFALPRALTMLERHPKGSQAFMPIGPAPYVAVVAPAGDSPRLEQVRAFLCQGRGVNLRRGTWHHPMMPLDGPLSFLVIERGGDDANCDILRLPEDALVVGR